jgi:hypothetical protein
MTTTTTDPSGTTDTPSKSEMAWRVIKMVFHSNTINAQTDISDFFTPDRLIFYENLFNGPVAQSLESTPYRWTDCTASEFSGITTAGELEVVVEKHLIEADVEANPNA